MADSIAPDYEVTGMNKSTEPNEQGGYHDVWKVNYTTASGVQSHVKIPATHLTGQNVHNLINHEKKHIHAVQNLPAGVQNEPAA